MPTALHRDQHLPFKLNAVHIFPDTFFHLTTVLSEAQRNAISTIRIYYPGIHYHLSLGLSQRLAQLGGLKRVVVEGERAWISQEEMQNIVETVKHCIGDRIVQVEFEVID